jgi:hypothetical protein
VFEFNEDPGTGNLSLRALLAALVGPRRIAHGRRTVKRIPLQQTIQMLTQPKGVEVNYFEVWLPTSSILALPGAGAFISFSSSENAGESAFQILLSSTQRYQGVLLPDDDLYAQAVSDAAGGPLAAPVPVVISSVVF